jgi:hypothetical protein
MLLNVLIAVILVSKAVNVVHTFVVAAFERPLTSVSWRCCLAQLPSTPDRIIVVEILIEPRREPCWSFLSVEHLERIEQLGVLRILR